MGTTANYSWPTPVATDLVKDGWEAIKDLGDAADTTVKAVSDAQGLVHINTTSFSAVSAVSIENVFSATYKNYRILLNHSNSAGAVTTHLRLRNAGSDASTNYYHSGIQTSSNSATINSYRADNSTFFGLGDGDGASSYACVIDIFSPFESAYTRFSSNFVGRLNNYKSFWQLGGHDTSSSYSSFTIYVTSGTLTGSITVMGYNA